MENILNLEKDNNSAKEKIQDTLDELRWKSKNEDNSTSNPAGVSLEVLKSNIPDLKIVSESEWEDTEEETPRSGGDSYKVQEKKVKATLGDEEVDIVVTKNWHGGINSGNEYEDCRLTEVKE